MRWAQITGLSVPELLLPMWVAWLFSLSCSSGSRRWWIAHETARVSNCFCTSKWIAPKQNAGKNKKETTLQWNNKWIEYEYDWIISYHIFSSFNCLRFCQALSFLKLHWNHWIKILYHPLHRDGGLHSDTRLVLSYGLLRGVAVPPRNGCARRMVASPALPQFPKQRMWSIPLDCEVKSCLLPAVAKINSSFGLKEKPGNGVASH